MFNQRCLPSQFQQRAGHPPFKCGKGFARLLNVPRDVSNIRLLRGIAKETHDFDVERNLFILERQAELGVSLKKWLKKGWRSWPLKWPPLGSAVLLLLYYLFSDYGRSALNPFIWFILLNGIGFFGLYWWVADKPSFDSVASITLVNILPIGAFAKSATELALIDVFVYGIVPWQAHGIAIFQGIVNAVLVFLLALALRNHFKVK